MAETDPAERSKKGNMLMARVGLRAVAAITSAPLQKLALRQEARIKDLETKLALAEKRPFRETIGEEPEVQSRLSPAALDAIFDYSYFVREVDKSFARMGLLRD